MLLADSFSYAVLINMVASAVTLSELANKEEVSKQQAEKKEFVVGVVLCLLKTENASYNLITMTEQLK